MNRHGFDYRSEKHGRDYLKAFSTDLPILFKKLVVSFPAISAVSLPFRAAPCAAVLVFSVT